MSLKNSSLKEMSLIDHLVELRKRLLWSFVYLIIIFIICFYFADTLFAFLAKPLVELMDTESGQGFIYTALQEAFFTELRIAFFFSSLTIALLLVLVAVELYPNLLMSSIDPEYHINIYNSASSTKSLKIMMTFVAIGGPLVLGYTVFVYRTFKGKVRLDETSY